MTDRAVTRIVVAGFGPFPGAPSNPTAALVTALARRRRPALAGVEIQPHVFATAYAAVDRDLPRLLRSKPDVVLLFGLAARRRHVCIETRARNVLSTLFPDVGGKRPSTPRIASGAPPVMRGNAPFARLLATIRSHGLPVRLSRDAGRYLCNYAFWRALEGTQRGKPLVQFVHIPRLRTDSRPRRRRSRPTLAHVVRAAEALSIALAAASRH